MFSLHGKRMSLVEDRVWWMENKSGEISFKSPYKALELGPSTPFPMHIIWSSVCNQK